MKKFNQWVLKFQRADWRQNPVFGVIDTILESHPEIIEMCSKDILGDEKHSELGRQDTPSVEQIVRAAIFKEMKSYDYRELEFAQADSRICATFIKLDERKPFSFQVFQKFISRIKKQTLHEILVLVNKIAIEEGFESVTDVLQDSTVVESNIHYPTNNSLVWDCIKTSTDLLRQLKEEMDDFSFINYCKSAKKTYYKINLTKKQEQRCELFWHQLVLFTKVINQTSNAIKKKPTNIIAASIQERLTDLFDLMNKVYDIAYRKEINGEQVPNDEKIFSIYELHTDIIVKGQREIQFGHKINLATGKSNLVLDCQVLKGNPSDKDLFVPTLERVIGNYEITPRNLATDGGYASICNLEAAKDAGIRNIVFNKVVGRMQNIVSSKNMETILKKYRSTIEAVISNIKRGFNLRVCNWKGWEHFQAKVLWSVLAYNFRVLTCLILADLKKSVKVS
jgi:IS5 family transposase